MNKQLVLLLFLTSLIISCSNQQKESVSKIQYMESPSIENRSELPYLRASKGRLFMSWIERGENKMASLKFSEMVKDTWNASNEIVNGDDWFVNWADFPVFVENDGQFLSHVLKKSSNETFAYDIKLNLFSKKDNAWITDLTLHSDGTKTEHGFVSMLPYKKDSFFVTWLDGRNTGGGENDGGHHGAMSIRAGVIDAMGILSDESVLDDKTCDCCQTTAAMTSNGPVVIYRDRSNDEVRDISIVRLVDGAWTEPVPIFNDNWVIKGCPVNGPKADALENQLAVSWFTAVDNKPKIQVVFSDTNGAYFDEPITVSDVNPMGRVDLAFIDRDNVLVSWMEGKEDVSELRIIKIHRSGKKSEPMIIAEMASSRKSGFPQMEMIKDKIYVAWTHVDDNKTSIKSLYFSLKMLKYN